MAATAFQRPKIPCWCRLYRHRIITVVVYVYRMADVDVERQVCKLSTCTVCTHCPPVSVALVACIL